MEYSYQLWKWLDLICINKIEQKCIYESKRILAEENKAITKDIIKNQEDKIVGGNNSNRVNL